MGGIVSLEDASLIFTTPDGIGIHEDFARGYEPDMPLAIKRPFVTHADDALIREHWATISTGSPAFLPQKHMTPVKFFHATFYTKLFARVPSARSLFRSSLTLQGKSITGMVHTLATLIRSRDVVETAQRLAAMHASYGACKEHYADVGIVLLETLEAVSGPAWSEKIKTAYLTAYCFVYYLMLPVILSTPVAPIAPSVDAHIVASEAIASNVQRLRILVDVALQYHPGDALVVGVPLSTGEVRASFALTSLYDADSREIELCVESIDKVFEWLCNAPLQSKLQVFWVLSSMHWELDTPTSLPRKALFLSEGAAGAPYFAIVRALYAARESCDCDVLWLQCGSEPIPYFEHPFNDEPWARLARIYCWIA
ncbi:hypothetical protein SPRG_00947 [Saprolegnia parasitica CBS 223.65]|uniref:Globin domain-containing protein n=1 Tax=Saprolegnia parasitica (strain CBS 223.65) TaxID=695850 RepID=A0A067CW00_SAPPC|nr:hypothetical protein SPRG_00947 [Saprolegnia parasitica CBS 223.65]KDO34889.1 hypothetical protein SPRG_00947 [Saprolegnia parasitica CBS 223.65]|eukprot:XP_012194548.1 hypothetical protein SPRG_00947 [Saprolegnia parasitica CBS 223.65]